MAARDASLGLQGQARGQAAFDEDRQGLVAAVIDIDQRRVRVIALVGARALVLGDELGASRLDRPGAGPRQIRWT
ncbi:hypothetical protein [Caulobacter sp. 1776]|uniref:hypothetical protein n=1 Tax=Caulobacter sp. 1776 TaxID=3156420 RepID=UPI0033969E95